MSDFITIITLSWGFTYLVCNLASVIIILLILPYKKAILDIVLSAYLEWKKKGNQKRELSNISLFN